MVPVSLNKLIVGTEPSLTWYIDRAAGRIVGTCDGLTAVRQAAEIILSTQRFEWQIYDPSSGTDYRHLIGRDVGYVGSELLRRVREALLMDSRITGVSNYSYAFEAGVLSASFNIDTIYGSFSAGTEVSING